MGAVAQMRIGVAWCTDFQRRSWNPLRNPHRLDDAYRAPSLVASEALALGAEVVYLALDEQLDPIEFETLSTAVGNLDLLWITTHGTFGTSGYSALLKAADYAISSEMLDSEVVVLETCNLVDRSQTGWESLWLKHKGNLRLALGFEGSATIDADGSDRAIAFLSEVDAGATFADAWFDSVANTSAWYPQGSMDQPVALAFGTSRQDASDVLSCAAPGNVTAAGGALTHVVDR